MPLNKETKLFDIECADNTGFLGEVFCVMMINMLNYSIGV